MKLSSLNLHIYATKHDLPQNLKEYAADIPGSPFSVFRHPLWTDIFPVAVPIPIEQLLLDKQSQLDVLLDKDDVSGFVFLHERAFRMDVLDDLWSSGTFDHRPEAYWELARQVWIDSEQDEDDYRWTRLLQVPLPNRQSMTTKEEWAALSREPDFLTLYRGVHGFDAEDAKASCARGWSWTLSKKTAMFFARRLLKDGHQGFVAAAHAPKSEVIAHLLSRGEAEIIIPSSAIDPDTLTLSIA